MITSLIVFAINNLHCLNNGLKMARIADQTVIAAYRQLIDSQKTLLLSTCSVSQGADISYAPFIQKGRFFIFMLVSWQNILPI